MGYIRKLREDWKLSGLTLLSLGALYGVLASFARVFDLRLVGLDVMEAVRLVAESYMILTMTVFVLGITVFGLSVAVWRLSTTVSELE